MVGVVMVQHRDTLPRAAKSSLEEASHFQHLHVREHSCIVCTALHVRKNLFNRPKDVRPNISPGTYIRAARELIAVLLLVVTRKLESAHDGTTPQAAHVSNVGLILLGRHPQSSKVNGTARPGVHGAGLRPRQPADERTGFR